MSQWRQLHRTFESKCLPRHSGGTFFIITTLLDTRTCVCLRCCSYGHQSRIHALTAEAMAALATRRPPDPRSFLASCFLEGTVPEQTFQEKQQQHKHSSSKSPLGGWDDARPPFLVYFEPALVRVARQKHCPNYFVRAVDNCRSQCLQFCA